MIKTAIAIIILASMNLTAGTPKKYQLDCREDLLVKSREIALLEVGKTERTGRNDGEVEKYNIAVGKCGKRQPYCAAGTYWCFASAADALHIEKCKIPIPRTALANAIFDYAKRHGKIADYTAEIDDLIVWRRGKSIHGHIERIVELGEKGWVTTVAFNTEIIQNGRTLHGVFLKKRNIFHPISRLKLRGLVGFKKV